jgi:hypothetical protein
MSLPEKQTPGASRVSANENKCSVSVLPRAAKPGRAKTGHSRYIRLFPERVLFAAELLTDHELVAWLRLALAYVVRDGELPADDAHLAAVTKTGKKWPALREKLLMLGLGRIESGQWIDDHQQSSLELQRSQSFRGSKGAAARWGGRDGS